MFKDAIIDAVETAINDLACGELMSLGQDLLGDVLEIIRKYLEKLISDDSKEHYLDAENNLYVPPEINLLDFSTLGKESGDWFQTLLGFVDDILGEKVKDPKFPNFVDLRINSLLRNLVLDNDRALNVEFNDLVIFDGRDLLTETIIELDRVKVYGLDTIDSFDSLEGAGKYTMLNHFSWQFLSVALDFTITMKPSSEENSIIDVPGGLVEEVVEKMTISAGINDVDVDFHILLAVDKEKVGGMELGSITDLSNVLPCVLDTIYEVEVAGFVVNSTGIDLPTLSGFVSTGIDKVMTNAASAVFNMYEASLIKVLPSIFQTSIRTALNDLLKKYIATADKNCPKKEFPSNKTFVNFGDLLLTQEEAVKVGGSGMSQYGHVFRDAMALLQDEILSIYLSDGRSYLNELIVSKITEKQSSIPGCLRFPNEYGTGFKLELGEFVANMEFKLSNATIRNIDTISAPLNLLEPISPQALNNTLAIGVVNNPLQGSVVLAFGLNDGRKFLFLCILRYLGFAFISIISNIYFTYRGYPDEK